jgi:hypothetical protein
VYLNWSHLRTHLLPRKRRQMHLHPMSPPLFRRICLGGAVQAVFGRGISPLWGLWLCACWHLGLNLFCSPIPLKAGRRAFSGSSVFLVDFVAPWRFMILNLYLFPARVPASLEHHCLACCLVLFLFYSSKSGSAAIDDRLLLYKYEHIKTGRTGIEPTRTQQGG